MIHQVTILVSAVLLAACGNKGELMLPTDAAVAAEIDKFDERRARQRNADAPSASDEPDDDGAP